MDRNKAIRTVARSNVTRLCNAIRAICESPSSSGADLKDLERKRILLQQKASELKQLDAAIIAELPIEDLEAEDKVIMQYEELVVDITCTMQEWCEAHKKTDINHQEPNQSNNSNGNTSNSATSDSRAGMATSKLPKLELKQFNGDQLKWSTFWDHFEATVHNSNLPDVEKFGYLKTLVTGEAEAVIEGLSLTSGNYNVAVEKLQNRYGDTDTIIQLHMASLLKIDPMKPPYGLKELIRVYDKVDSHVRALKQLGLEERSYGTMLYATLRGLISKKLLYTYAEMDGEGTVRSLLQFLDARIRQWKKCEDLGKQEHTNVQKTSKKDSYPRHVTSTTSALTTGATPRSTFCIFCEMKGHWTSECTQSRTLQQKLDILKRSRRCFKCLKKGHLGRDCTRVLKCMSCGGGHSSAMCDNVDKASNLSTSTVGAQDQVLQIGGHCATTQALGETNGTVVLQTAKVKIQGPGKEKMVRCLMDNGSQQTFITERMSKSLGLLCVGEQLLNVCVFGGASSTIACKRVKFRVESRDGKFGKTILAYTVPYITAQILPVHNAKSISNFKMAGLLLAEDVFTSSEWHNGEVDLLIGGDIYWEIMTGEIMRLTEGLVAANSHFGWMLQGPMVTPKNLIGSSTQLATLSVFHLAVNYESAVENVEDQLQRFWGLEHLGLGQPDNSKANVTEIFANCVKQKDARYIVELPWKEGMCGKLGNNKQQALGRLFHLTKRLSYDIELMKQYDEIIRDYIRKGYAEAVVSQGTDDLDSVYYMPHRYVKRDDKLTTKVRIVFDASSHGVNEFSLNDCVHVGPNLTNNMLHVLLQFRAHAVAMTGDIQQAFLQIELAEKDRDFVRFLWYDSWEDAMAGRPYKTFRMARVLFGLNASPFLLSATIKHHLQTYSNQDSATMRALYDNLYVDDLVTGTISADEATVLQKEVQDVLLDANMNMRQWRTNNHGLRSRWKELGIDLHPEGTRAKVLGLQWNEDEDTLALSWKPSKHKGTIITKRSVISQASQVYDPLGLCSPFSLRAKLLFQKLWIAKIGWDEAIPAELEVQWREWLGEAEQLNKVKVDRWYFQNIGLPEKQELHMFCDASALAYGAAVYLKCSNRGNISTQLVFAKTRVAPVKGLTIPKMELLAALLGTRMVEEVRKALPFSVTVVWCWSDSKIALFWITSCMKRRETFVENKVKEIRKLSKPSQWRHCPGTDNPADLLTRGMKIPNLLLESKWWMGPNWLADEENWPLSVIDEVGDSNSTQQCLIQGQGVEPLLVVESFSNLKRMLRITAWCFRFIGCARKQGSIVGPLTVGELMNAELYWVKFIQEKHYANEKADLLNGKCISSESPLYQFAPFVDSCGTICLGGRLQATDCAWTAQHPVILPSKDAFTHLLIMDAHISMKHSGVSSTLCYLRQRYWILKGRTTCKQVIHTCLICRRARAQPATQEIAPLPKERLDEVLPFTYVGVDFAGPLMIKAYPRPEKAYFCLFTCATCRAVHLEVVHDMSANQFMLALRRFVARRGVPTMMISDNGKTFHRASKELKFLQSLEKDPEVRTFLLEHHVDWKFILERAPWWGGFWERLVQTVKTALKKALGKSLLTFVELQTTLTEIEAVINDRPLSYMYSEANEPDPITPSMLVSARRILTLPHTFKTPDSTTLKQAEVTKRLRHRRLVLAHALKRWKNEYLMQLRNAHMSMPKVSTEIRVGDIVLIREEKAATHTWQMGRVIEVTPGRDGKIRACLLQVRGGKKMKRPIQMLYPLEGVNHKNAESATLAGGECGKNGGLATEAQKGKQ